MKIKIPTTIERNVTRLRIVAAVNYGEEEMPSDFPGRSGDTWRAEIDIEAGRILNWPAGRVEDLHLTVKDEGSYELLDEAGQRVAIREQNYVPHSMVPGSYGDTIELKIGPDGTITNWPRRPSVEDFFPKED